MQPLDEPSAPLDDDWSQLVEYLVEQARTSTVGYNTWEVPGEVRRHRTGGSHPPSALGAAHPHNNLRLRDFVGFGRSGAGVGVMLQGVRGLRSCRSW